MIENDLNAPQLKAVTLLQGPVCIIAGAGSGKTRVITYRIAQMLQKGIPQSNILALTFTNKAAREMENRVRSLTGRKLTALTMSTFHAFGVKILREEIEVLGYRKNFSIYDSTDKIDLIKECLREMRLYNEKVDLKKLEAFFSNIKIGQGGQPGMDEPEQLMLPAYDEYQKSLKVYNAVDFDDLLVLPIKLFTEHPEILQKYREKYKYILVDEFQDTSLVQYKLLCLLAKSDEGKSNICVVGDDDQSIYSWRGANYDNLLHFERDFPGTVEIKLEENYRSTTTILEAANGLISHNINRKGKTLYSNMGEGKPIIVSYPDNENIEAENISLMIKKLRNTENRNYNDFGILVRTNNQFDVIEEALLASNIPYKVSGGTSFFERKEIRDILSYLRLIANHDDDVNLLRIINTPRRGIGKASIQGAAAEAKQNSSSLYRAFSRISRARNAGQGSLFLHESSGTGIDEFLELLHAGREAFFGPGVLSKKVSAFVDKIDYWSYLVSEYSKNEKIARWKLNNIKTLIKMIEDLERVKAEDEGPEENISLYNYLNRISLITRIDGDDDDGDGGKVSLMTIHACKGLEFPVVFIAGAEEGFIPHERSEDVEEERRLFYVAITRAQDKLYISSCKRRINNRNRTSSDAERGPSPFLNEIPGHLIGNEQEEIEDDDAFIKRLKERFKA